MSVLDGGIVLALSFALLCPLRIELALALGSAQAAALAGAAIARGSYKEAVAILLLNGIALPGLLRSLPPSGRRPMRVPNVTMLSAGGILALLAAPLNVPLAVVLLGILLAASTRDRTAQVLGLLAMQNGIALAGLDLPDVERVAAILPVIPALAWAALWTCERRQA